MSSRAWYYYLIEDTEIAGPCHKSNTGVRGSGRVVVVLISYHLVGMSLYQ